MTECKHSFEVEKVCEGLPLAQILNCKKCGGKFFGFEGEIGKPDYLHQIDKTRTYAGVLDGKDIDMSVLGIKLK